MRAYIVPFRFQRRLALGNEEGLDIKGPILYVPERGAILYKTGITGDAERMGFVTNDVDYFSDDLALLSQLERQVKGERPQHGNWESPKFDLSEGLLEVDVSDGEFNDIAKMAKEAYEVLRRFRLDSMKLITELQRQGGQNIYGKLV
jgi:hypothetical protein